MDRRRSLDLLQPPGSAPPTELRNGHAAQTHPCGARASCSALPKASVTKIRVCHEWSPARCAIRADAQREGGGNHGLGVLRVSG